jgi:hypothetical protein
MACKVYIMDLTYKFNKPNRSLNFKNIRMTTDISSSSKTQHRLIVAKPLALPLVQVPVVRQ